MDAAPRPPQATTETAGSGRPDPEALMDLLAVVPERVAERYREAWRVQAISPTACAMLIGSTLEAICACEQVAGSTLPEKLTALAQRKRIPTLLVDMAHALRYLRNIGSHEVEDSILPEDIPIMLTGLEALVSYLYLLPRHHAALDERLRLHLEARQTRGSPHAPEQAPPR